MNVTMILVFIDTRAVAPFCRDAGLRSPSLSYSQGITKAKAHDPYLREGTLQRARVQGL